ncbi:TPA: hypothetical protein R4K21_003176 [Stenotrophomonas maltophilia]|nr:hypothetical protein [Stenotrophomonas maltophilia]
MNIWMWIAGLVLLGAFIEAWGARLNAKRASDAAEALRIEIGLLRQQVECRLDEVVAAVDDLAYKTTPRQLSEIDPADNP